MLITWLVIVLIYLFIDPLIVNGPVPLDSSSHI